VPARRAHDRHVAAPPRGRARFGEPWQQRVEPPERERRPRPEDAQRVAPPPRRNVAQQRVRQRDVEQRVVRRRVGDELERQARDGSGTLR
jgi:hypothetical protein